MLKALLVIAVILVVGAAGVLAYASTRPDTFQVVRSTVVKAPPEKIIALIEDFRRWREWSPFEEMDPNLKRAYSGAAKGKGAIYEWQGDGRAGAGRMEIAEVLPSRKVAIKLDFTKPMTAHNIAEFTLAPEGEATKVTWDMHGPNPLIGKVMHLFFNFDRMVGGEFEKGLAKLKAAAETG
ncbi:SRPBCC family protein [Methylopila sp. M107]|uniref:SRPBCC family protein n=1 Tax=Methylopila sp. M107 TaxID=1101190 RepID=UPI000373DAF7|nr:SRPBCC family protein [Methylopila sp. M107]